MKGLGIDERCDAAGGTVAVLLQRCRDGRVLYRRNAERSLAAASTIKVLLLAALLEEGLPWEERIAVDEAEKVPYSLVTLLDNPVWSLGDLARLMILDSDNTATNVLLDRVGMERVNERGRRMGLKGTLFRRKMMDQAAAAAGRENVTTLADQARLWGLLWAVACQQALPEGMSPRLWGGADGARTALEILCHVRTDSMLLRYFTEEECPLAHKAGGLPYARHEAGLFFPRSPEGADYFFGVFTAGLSEPLAKELIGRLSRDVYETRKEWLHD